MKQLAITILGTDRPGICNELCKLVANTGCNIVSSRITILGSEFVANILLNGTWNALAKFESSLPAIEQKHKLHSIIKRTETQKYPDNLLPYTIHVVALDQPGTVFKLTNFFAEQEINVNELIAISYTAPYTSTQMTAITMSISIPSSMHIADVRERFIVLCDDMNMDAIMEPEKN